MGGWVGKGGGGRGLLPCSPRDLKKRTCALKMTASFAILAMSSAADRPREAAGLKEGERGCIDVEARSFGSVAWRDRFGEVPLGPDGLGEVAEPADERAGDRSRIDAEGAKVGPEVPGSGFRAGKTAPGAFAGGLLGEGCLLVAAAPEDLCAGLMLDFVPGFVAPGLLAAGFPVGFSCLLGF